MLAALKTLHSVSHETTIKSEKSQIKEIFKSTGFICSISIFFQAILFYVPRWLWKNWEAGKIHALMMDLDIGVVQDVEKRQKKRLLLDYLADNLKHHNWWAYRYFFCEFLALVNIIGKSKIFIFKHRNKFVWALVITFALISSLLFVSFAIKMHQNQSST